MTDPIEKDVLGESERSTLNPSPLGYSEDTDEKIAAIRRVLIGDHVSIKEASAHDHQTIGDIIERNGGRMAGPGPAQ